MVVYRESIVPALWRAVYKAARHGGSNMPAYKGDICVSAETAIKSMDHVTRMTVTDVAMVMLPAIVAEYWLLVYIMLTRRWNNEL